MNLLVTVYDLATGREYVFENVTPPEAVVRAWCLEHGRCNTWEWAREVADRYGDLTWGRHSVAYGDFVASTCEATP